ncbi:hypothetical protein GCM10025734_19790 [Kitasatospora paranensis]
MSSSTRPPATARPRFVLRRRLAAPLRLGRPSDIWYKPALSVVAAAAVPDALLLAAGRLDLAMATTAGALCALYGHHLPYAARARAVALVLLGMLAGFGTAMAAAALTHSVVVLVAVGALLAAVQKAVCDATRIGPPGHVVLAFVSSAALFVPLSAPAIAGRLGLAAAAGAFAWLVCLAPALIRRDGPERHAVARALDAAAAYAATPEGPHRTRPRAVAAAALHAAWSSLPTPADGPARRGGADRCTLVRLLGHAEAALAAAHTGGPAPGGAADPGRLRGLALALRTGAPCPPRTRPAPNTSPDTTPGTPPSPGTPPHPAPPCCACSARARRCCRSCTGRSSAAPWPAGVQPRSASAARPGRWSPPPRSTRPTARSPGTGPCSGWSATCSGYWSSPPSCPSPTSAPSRWCSAAWPATSARRR